MSLVFLDSQGYQAFLVFPVGQVDLDSTGGEETIDEAALAWRMMGLSRVFDNGKAIISESCFLDENKFSMKDSIKKIDIIKHEH